MQALRAAVDVQSFTYRLATTSDGRANCRVYRSLNGIVEGRVCDRGNARCGVDAPMFRDAAT